MLTVRWIKLSYEQALLTIRQRNLPMKSVEEQFRLMVFNVIARNQDDHVKNIAFLMTNDGQWSLAPAFDMTYSFNSAGVSTATHQMAINGTRDGSTVEDFRACAKPASMKRPRRNHRQRVRTAVLRWPDFAEMARVNKPWRAEIQKNLRLSVPDS